MPSSAPAPRSARTRISWETPARSPAQERFYRELMNTQELPSAPEIAQRMLVAVNREGASVQELTQLIARDQALAARLLRLANSAFFAIRTRVTSIPQSVTLLGFARVRDLVLGLSVWSAFHGTEAGRRHRRTMWVHAATVAAAAKMLAERTGADGPAAFSAGLLHDIGKLVLGLRLGDTYWALLDEAATRGAAAATVETETFGCHHAIVGAWLLQLWQLPPTLVDPVAQHHDALIPDFGLDLPATLAVADRLVNATDPKNGLAREETLAEIHAFAPGLLANGEWQQLWASLAAEQQAIAGIFDS